MYEKYRPNVYVYRPEDEKAIETDQRTLEDKFYLNYGNPELGKFLEDRSFKAMEMRRKYNRDWTGRNPPSRKEWANKLNQAKFTRDRAMQRMISDPNYQESNELTQHNLAGWRYANKNHFKARLWGNKALKNKYYAKRQDKPYDFDAIHKHSRNKWLKQIRNNPNYYNNN